MLRSRTAALVPVLALTLAGCAANTSIESGPDAEVSTTALAAEAALNAGDFPRSGELYREAALKTPDLGVIASAAEIAFTYGRSRDARAVLDHWQSVEPGAVDPIVYSARLHLRDGNVDGAIERFDAFVAASTDSPDEIYDRLSQILLTDGSAAEALAVARGLRERHADVWQAQRLLSRVAMRADEVNLAMEGAEIAYELAPDRFETGILQAQAILVGGDRSAGLEFAAEVAERASGSSQRLEYAGLLAAADQVDEATDIVRDVLDTEPDNVDAIRALAALDLKRGDVGEAWDRFSDLARRPDARHDALFYLAGIAESQDRTAQALRLYRQVGDGSHRVAAEQRIGQLLLRTEGSDAALEHLETVSRERPEVGFRLMLPRAALLSQIGKTDEALDLYDKVLDLRPHSEPVMLTRAQTLLDADRLDDAIDQYRESLDLHPDSALSLNALGYTLADRTDQFDEARDLIERALELAPDNAAIIDSMGWVLFKVGELEEARLYLERAWSLIKDPEVAAHLGETLWHLGEKDEARAILKEAFDRTPNSKPLRETIKRLLREEERVTS